jgi:hypothetical protein
VTGGCRILHNEDLHNLYVSPNIIKVINEYEMGGTCRTHAEKRNWYDILFKGIEEKKSVGHLLIDGRIIATEMCLTRYGVATRTGFIWLRIGTSGALCSTP